MKFQQISNETICEVHEFVCKIKADKFWPRKKSLFSQLSMRLSDDAQELFKYCCNFSLFNGRFYKLDISRYHTLQLAEKNCSTFKHFLAVVKALNGKHITPKREPILIEFLQTCDKTYFDFYSLLFEKNFHKDLPATEIQNIFDLDEISLDDTYADIEPLQGKITELRYPLAVTKIKDTRSMFLLHSRHHTGQTWNRTFIQNNIKRIKSNLLKDQKVFIKAPQYAIAGYLDTAKVEIPTQKYKRIKAIESLTLIPTDIFKNYDDYRRYYDGRSHTDFKTRIKNLNKFLYTNFTTQIQDTYVGFATDDIELESEIRKVLGSDESSYILLTDSESSRTNKIHAVECVKVQTIIDDFWSVDGVPKGFICGHNGRRNRVSFEFSGKHNVLLNSIDIVKNKVMTSLYLDCGTVKIYTGVELKFNAKTWRVRPLPDTDIMLEKCVMCGSDDKTHSQRGICSICENNLPYYYETYGHDNWIKPSNIMTKKRRLSGWEPGLLNMIKFRFRGTIIICREDGWWKFEPSDEALAEYNWWLEKLGMN